jgi:hypothetical protein
MWEMSCPIFFDGAFRVDDPLSQERNAYVCVPGLDDEAMSNIFRHMSQEWMIIRPYVRPVGLPSLDQIVRAQLKQAQSLIREAQVRSPSEAQVQIEYA